MNLDSIKNAKTNNIPWARNIRTWVMAIAIVTQPVFFYKFMEESDKYEQDLLMSVASGFKAAQFDATEVAYRGGYKHAILDMGFADYASFAEVKTSQKAAYEKLRESNERSAYYKKAKTYLCLFAISSFLIFLTFLTLPQFNSEFLFFGKQKKSEL